MKALLLVRHGPELRLLDALQDSDSYSEIVLLAEAKVSKEVHEYLNGELQCMVHAQPTPTPRSRRAAYLAALMDSLARRLNRKRGIGHYSYAKRSTLRSSTSSQQTPIGKFELFYWGAVIRLLARCVGLLCSDRHLQSLLRDSGCQVLIVCDHLGGSDLVAYNAQRAGFSVHYYLNNHKDLSVRPYVPTPASRMFTWFPEQQSVLLDICQSHSKLSPIGPIRVDSLLKRTCGYVPGRAESVITVLHCCADARRRPYELHSLLAIFELVKKLSLPVRFWLRMNPMGPALDPERLSDFDFVNVLDHGWHWDETKFLNFPNADAEAAYARQLMDHDVVSALPSTSLVEGYCFKKSIVCLLDHASPDADSEAEELSLCIPENVLASRNSAIARSPKEYLDILIRIKKNG